MWTKEQARENGRKGGAGRGRQITALAKARKEALLNGSLETINALSPIGALEAKIAVLVQSGACNLKLERLTAMLAKLQSAEAKVIQASGKRRSIKDNNYCANNSRGSIAAPQGLTTQAPVQPMGSTTHGVPGPLKESILPGPPGVGAPGGGPGGAGGGGVNTLITPTANEPNPVPEPSVVPDSVPTAGPVPCPGPGWVKVKIGTVWVWGRRNS